jgi:hypothetical protein
MMLNNSLLELHLCGNHIEGADGSCCSDFSKLKVLNMVVILWVLLVLVRWHQALQLQHVLWSRLILKTVGFETMVWRTLFPITCNGVHGRLHGKIVPALASRGINLDEIFSGCRFPQSRPASLLGLAIGPKTHVYKGVGACWFSLSSLVSSCRGSTPSSTRCHRQPHRHHSRHRSIRRTALLLLQIVDYGSQFSMLLWFRFVGCTADSVILCESRSVHKH